MQTFIKTLVLGLFLALSASSWADGHGVKKAELKKAVEVQKIKKSDKVRAARLAGDGDGATAYSGKPAPKPKPKPEPEPPKPKPDPDPPKDDCEEGVDPDCDQDDDDDRDVDTDGLRSPAEVLTPGE